MAQNGWYKWTAVMDAFLLENYEWIGDNHLAEMFAQRFPKPYPWTKKHIEKRRSYLNLKRTAEQVKIIRILNNKDGRHFKMWDKRGACPVGTVKNWNGRQYIKTEQGYRLYARTVSNAKPGQIARSFEGGIRLITQAENARLNNARRAALPIELKKTITTLNQLKKIVYGKKEN